MSKQNMTLMISNLLTRLKLNFTHLTKHKFGHVFRITIDHICKCGNETEVTLHYLFRCNIYIFIS